jgi:hypothetical protein
VGNHDTWKYCEVHLLDADGLEGCAGTGVWTLVEEDSRKSYPYTASLLEGRLQYRKVKKQSWLGEGH